MQCPGSYIHVELFLFLDNQVFTRQIDEEQGLYNYILPNGPRGKVVLVTLNNKNLIIINLMQ